MSCKLLSARTEVKALFKTTPEGSNVETDKKLFVQFFFSWHELEASDSAYLRQSEIQSLSSCNIHKIAITSLLPFLPFFVDFHWQKTKATK